MCVNLSTNWPWLVREDCGDWMHMYEYQPLGMITPKVWFVSARNFTSSITDARDLPAL